MNANDPNDNFLSVAVESMQAAGAQGCARRRGR